MGAFLPHKETMFRDHADSVGKEKNRLSGLPDCRALFCPNQSGIDGLSRCFFFSFLIFARRRAVFGQIFGQKKNFKINNLNTIRAIRAVLNIK